MKRAKFNLKFHWALGYPLKNAISFQGKKKRFSDYI